MSKLYYREELNDLPRYSDNLINEVLSENDIVDVVSQYVRLKSNGRDYTGLCPFHKEKSPSFHVNRDKQVFHCFGCGAGGGLMQFVMKIEGLDFVESLKLLADRAGIALPEEGDIKVDDAKHRMRQKILEINKVSARFFYETLTKSPDGKIALEYFKNRKITPKTIINYGLGYSPDKYDALLGHLRRLGYSDRELVESGVVIESNGKIFDRFAGRVIFPIIDLRGNVIGFGGRIITDRVLANGKKPAKYLNTSNTLVYDKGRNLFSLNLAKKANARKLILCEGYMDVISVYQAGIPNVVATLGTALTENQAKLLMKYCDEILICYDSDEAGQTATRRAIDVINSVGGRARVISMSGAKDPDEYIKANGVEMFKRLVENALPSSEYLIRNAKKDYNLDTEAGKIGYIGKAVESLIGVKDTVEVDAYIRKVSKESDISVDAIYAEYRKKTAVAKMEQERAFRTPVASVGTTAVKASSTKIETAQIKLLGLCSQEKKLYKLISSEFGVEEYTIEPLKKLATDIYMSWEAGVVPDAAAIMTRLGEEEARLVSQVFCTNELYSDNEVAAKELIMSIKKEKIELMLAGETNPAKIKELILMRDKIGRNE